MIIHRLALCLAVAGALLAGAANAADAEPFRPEPWVADLDQLRDALTAGYANLEWQAERGLDLPGLYARTRRQLEAAHDANAARQAFEAFTGALADRHLRVRWPNPPAAASGGAPPDLCQTLGYTDLREEAVVTQLAGFRPVGDPTADFKAGVVEVHGRKVGVLRVPIFTHVGIPDFCARLLAQARLTPASPCDDVCVARLHGLAETAFVSGLRDQLAAVVAERPDVLLIDVAGNRGGDNSALVLARMVTDRPLRRPATALIRGDATDRELASRQAEVRAVLGSGPAAQQAALARFDAALTAARTAAQAVCDRSGLWRGEAPTCTAMVAEPAYDGPLPSLRQSPPDWVHVASPTARFPDVGTLWRGPLIVLADGISASSAELLTAMLQDARAAVVLGARTAGAGCGHMTGAGPVKLANTGGLASMPDCLRRRADGSNEVAGVLPDIPVAWRANDTLRQRSDLLSTALPEAVELAIRQAR